MVLIIREEINEVKRNELNLIKKRRQINFKREKTIEN